MAMYTDKKAARYCNKVLNAVDGNRPELLNAWSDNFNRWFVCDGYRAYRLESEPDGLRIILGLKVNSPAVHARFTEVHFKIEAMFDECYTNNVVEIPVDINDVVTAARSKDDITIDLGENFPVVNARYLKDAMEMLPDGKVYCQDNARRMFSPVYVKSPDGIALILPIRRESKLHWVYKAI